GDTRPGGRRRPVVVPRTLGRALAEAASATAAGGSRAADEACGAISGLLKWGSGGSGNRFRSFAGWTTGVEVGGRGRRSVVMAVPPGRSAGRGLRVGRAAGLAGNRVVTCAARLGRVAETPERSRQRARGCGS